MPVCVWVELTEFRNRDLKNQNQIKSKQQQQQTGDFEERMFRRSQIVVETGAGVGMYTGKCSQRTEKKKRYPKYLVIAL